MIENNTNEFIYEENEENEQQKLKRYQINSYSIDRAIETLIKWKKNQKLIVPEFQRDFVWTYSNCCRLIDSILLNLPIPNIFVFKILDKENGERYLLVDGMQRITTIEQFYCGKWEQAEKERNFKINIKSSNWYKKDYDHLSDSDKEFFKDYPINVTIFESSASSKVKSNNVIFSVNIEFLLRLLTYFKIYKLSLEKKQYLVEGEEESKVTTSKTVMLNNYLYYSNSKLIDYTSDLNKINESISVIESLDNTAFYSVKRDHSGIGNRVHQVFSEALVISVIENDFKINISQIQFLDGKKEIWKNEELFYSTFAEKTTDPQNIIERVSLMLRFINGEQVWRSCNGDID